MKRLFFILLFASAACAAILAVPMLPDRLILFPTTHHLEAGEATRVMVPFPGGEVEVWQAQSRAARASGSAEVFILRFYGNADRAERWPVAEAQMWDERAVEVWAVNYPGYGGSTGPARLGAIGPAARAAFDALAGKAAGRPIIVFGTSLGTAAALHLAAERPVNGLLLHNPPPIREMILEQFGWWNLWLLAGPWSRRIPPALDSIANARQATARAVFLLAEHDEVVAPRFQRRVVEAYAGEKRILDLRGAYHNSPLDAAALAELRGAMEWLLAR